MVLFQDLFGANKDSVAVGYGSLGINKRLIRH